MPATKYTKKHSSSVDQNKKVVIVDPTYDNEIAYYHCDFCSLNIGVRLSNQQEEVICSRCGEVIAISKTRKVSKLTMPRKNTETLVADPRTLYGGDNPGKSVSIHHEPELKGGFLALSQKGLRIKNYREGNP